MRSPPVKYIAQLIPIIYTLDFEYRRDTDKGMNPAVPAHYYIDDDPSKGPIVRCVAKNPTEKMLKEIAIN